MLRKVIGYITVFVLLLAASCKPGPRTPADAQRMLAGRWELKLGHDCSEYGIQSDTLILHSDGRLEQHFVSTSGERYDATDQHWSYVRDNGVSFDTRRNFFSKQPPTGVIGVAIPESLIVEFGTPSVILTNPDSNCFYSKVEDDR